MSSKNKKKSVNKYKNNSNYYRNNGVNKNNSTSIYFKDNKNNSTRTSLNDKKKSNKKNNLNDLNDSKDLEKIDDIIKELQEINDSDDDNTNISINNDDLKKIKELSDSGESIDDLKSLDNDSSNDVIEDNEENIDDYVFDDNDENKSKENNEIKVNGNVHKNKTKYVIGTVLAVAIVLLCAYGVLFFIDYDTVKKYDDVILPNFYLDEYDMTNLSYDNAYELIKRKESEILKKKVKYIVNDKEYPIELGSMGLKIDIGKTFREIEKYQKKMSFPTKVWYIYKNEKKKNFKIYYSFNDETFAQFLTNFNNTVSVAPINGHIDASEGVKYVEGVDGFTLDVNKSREDIIKYFDGVSDQDELSIKLSGTKVSATDNESYKTIDTMTSSFVTTYDTGIYLRAQNLRTAINYINGAIIEPGETFSYHHYAGPYDKEGYVFYYKFYGNGVCQVATTVYNAALLGGLEIVKRSPHDKKSEYVDGGLDATVADYGSWNVDMQWKNTYDYPIYLKAYDYNGEVHVEFWSNHDAKGGKTYSTESRWLGGRSYKSYLHTYKDGVEIDVHEIASTYYIND